MPGMDGSMYKKAKNKVMLAKDATPIISAITAAQALFAPKCRSMVENALFIGASGALQAAVLEYRGVAA